jgi:adhesin transport system outer membrane protein
MRAKGFKLLALASSISLCAAMAQAETLTEAIGHGIMNHPEVKGAKNNKSAIKQDLKGAKAGYLPTVDLEVASGHERSNNNTTRTSANRHPGEHGHSSFWRNEATLSATQMLFDGFSTSSEVKQQRNRLKSAANNVADIQNAIAIRIIDAYLNVLKNEDLVRLAKGNLENHKNHLQQVQSRERGGRANQADVRQAEGRVSLAEANYYNSVGELDSAVADYIEAVGHEPKSLVKPSIPKAKIPSTQKDALAYAMENNPAIHSAQYDVDAAVQAKRNAKSALFPRFDLELSASRNQNLDGLKGANNDALAMVRMSYNLYRGGADIARKRERNSRLDEARESLEQDRRLVRENVQKAWNAYETASRRLSPLQAHVSASEKTREAYKSQFGIGQRTLLDLLDSEVELFNARSAYIDAKYAESFAVYEVLMNMGVVLDNVGLGDDELNKIKRWSHKKGGMYKKGHTKKMSEPAIKPSGTAKKLKTSGGDW